MSWTNERVDRLKVLWTDGMTAEQIACDLGDTTRNAVLGKVDRLGLEPRRKGVPRGSRSRARDKPHTPQAFPRAPDTEELQELASKPPRAGKPLSVLDIDHTTCKWPLDDGPDYTFCGAKPKAGKPYCPHHCAVAYIKPKSRNSPEHLARHFRRIEEWKGRIYKHTLEAAE